MEEILTKCVLFAQIEPKALPDLLKALGAIEKTYDKGEVLVLAGYELHRIGIVLYGTIEAAKISANGDAFTITQIGAGGIFGDVLAGSAAYKSPVCVTAHTQVRVLWISYEKLLAGGGAPAKAHTQMLKNLVAEISQKYFALDRRIAVLMLPRLREKIMYYLQNEAIQQPDGGMLTPFNRAELAQYLGCERAALCREISRMRSEKQLKTSGRYFYFTPAETNL
ncbi:MAG: Crp/Fnr family transcriptional regulator [Ruthenibacterium sp.]